MNKKHHPSWPAIFEDCGYAQLAQIARKIRARACSCANCESDLEIIAQCQNDIVRCGEATCE